MQPAHRAVQLSCYNEWTKISCTLSADRANEEGSTKPKHDECLQALAGSLEDILVAGRGNHASKVCAYKILHSYTKDVSLDLQHTQGTFWNLIWST